MTCFLNFLKLFKFSSVLTERFYFKVYIVLSAVFLFYIFIAAEF